MIDDPVQFGGTTFFALAAPGATSVATIADERAHAEIARRALNRLIISLPLVGCVLLPVHTWASK